MKKNSILLQAPNAVVNGSAIVRVHKYRDNFFYPVYGWTISGLNTNAENQIEINLDKDNILKSIESLQDTLPFGVTISVECPIGTEPIWITDMYHTDMTKTIDIIRNNNLDTSINAVTDLRVEGNNIVASFRGNVEGEFELYEIQDGEEIETASIRQRYSANIPNTSTRLDVQLPNTPSDSNNILARWRTTGERLFSSYIIARKAHTVKSVMIERHEIVSGNLLFYVFDRDTLGAFHETGLILRIKQGTNNFIVSGTNNIQPTRTVVVISGADVARIIGLGGIVDISAELIGGSITSNTYKFNTDNAIPTPPGGGATPGNSVKYLSMNADKIAADTDSKLVYLSFDSSNDAEIEKLEINSISNVTIDKSSYSLTNRQLNVKPSFGFWAKYTGTGNLWTSDISYTYRIKGTVDKTASITLTPDLPKLEVKIESVADNYNNKNAVVVGTYDVQRGANQKFAIKDLTFYLDNDPKYRYPNIVYLDENGRFVIQLEYQDRTMINMSNKVKFKYSFAGKPYSAEKEIEIPMNVLG